MTEMRKHGWIRRAAFLAITAMAFIALAAVPSRVNRAAAGDQDPAGARKAFIEASEVFYHPRCLNCHPAGDAPLVQDDSRPHRFNVKRGTEGRGTAMNCTMCHLNENQSGGPPGAPNWRMPPQNMPMVFQGRTPGELCRQLKDPAHNGGRTGEQIIGHLDEDPLVLHGWNPGEGRGAPGMSHREFSLKMRDWVRKGAACPE